MPGVYIAYPFCAQKCTFCNFASGVLPKELEPRYVQALVDELRTADWHWTPETVYLGGGTPSNLSVHNLTAILAAVPGGQWREATLEAAPGGLLKETVSGWRSVFINRISFGVQSFVDKELSKTGRKHNAAIVEHEILLLRKQGIESINVDLIAGLPGQTLESWHHSLDWIERLAVPHVSVYMLEVDDDSRLGREIVSGGTRYGAGDIPEDDRIADFYEIAVERLAKMGIPRYEISNFARPGFESIHNLKYWKREPYLGFGADGHSFDDGKRWQNPETALAYVQRIGNPAKTPADAIGEPFFLGLRLAEGIQDEASSHQQAIEQFMRDGLMEKNAGRVRLTSRGVLLSNLVFQEFVTLPDRPTGPAVRSRAGGKSNSALRVLSSG